MATRAKEILGADQLEVTADKGYYDSQDIKATVDERIIPYIPKPARRQPKEDGLFCKGQFIYDKDKDVYICPAKRELTFLKKAGDRGRKMRHYKGQDCPDCSLKEKCTKALRRTVSRWEHEEVLEEMQERVLLNQDKIR